LSHWGQLQSPRQATSGNSYAFSRPDRVALERKKRRLKKWHSQWHSFVPGFSRVRSALILSSLGRRENALQFSVSCKKGGFVNDETSPEMGSQRTKQEPSAAPEQPAAAPRTGAPNARNLAPEWTWRCARCGPQKHRSANQQNWEMVRRRMNPAANPWTRFFDTVSKLVSAFNNPPPPAFAKPEEVEGLGQ
jgi:hypothetical protein